MLHRLITAVQHFDYLRFSRIAVIQSELLSVDAVVFEPAPHICESGILPFFLEDSQHLLDRRKCVRMHHRPSLGSYEIVMCISISVLITLVDLACSHSVAEHLGYIFLRHFVAAETHRTVLVYHIIDPVFKVVLVAALVMHPRHRDTVLPALLVVRAPVALVIHGPAPELHRRILADVMQKPLSYKTESQAVSAYQIAVFRYCSEVLDRVHIIVLLLVGLEKLDSEVEFLACHLVVAVKSDHSVLKCSYKSRERSAELILQKDLVSY